MSGLDRLASTDAHRGTRRRVAASSSPRPSPWCSKSGHAVDVRRRDLQQLVEVSGSTDDRESPAGGRVRPRPRACSWWTEIAPTCPADTHTQARPQTGLDRKGRFTASVVDEPTPRPTKAEVCSWYHT